MMHRTNRYFIRPFYYVKGVILRCSSIARLYQRRPWWNLPAGASQWAAGFSRTTAATARHSTWKQWLLQVIYEFIHQFIRLADLYNFFLVFLFFFRECLQPAGDDCVAPPATFFVVDETSEKSRKGKKNTRYNFVFSFYLPFKTYWFLWWRGGKRGVL